VIFWTAFPHAFAAVMTTLALPLWLAVAGIVLRGAGLGFRKEITEVRWRRVTGITFAFSSLVTPSSWALWSPAWPAASRARYCAI
jgi:cytochrome bd ubiquinol oxidase subunit II